MSPQRLFHIAGSFPLKGHFEFHISRTARQRFGVERPLFELKDNQVIADLNGVDALAEQFNAVRLLSDPQNAAVQPAEIAAIGMIDEIMHALLGIYKQEKNASMGRHALAWLHARFDPAQVDAAMLHFVENFPPEQVYAGGLPPRQYLAKQTAGIPNTEVVLEEMLLLRLSNTNTAYQPLRELFDDRALGTQTIYHQIMARLHEFFDDLPRFGPEDQNLVDMLRSPAVAAPNSLAGQIDFVLEHWADLLAGQTPDLVTNLDHLAAALQPKLPGPGPAQVYDFAALGLSSQQASFSQDQDWMPNLVLVAKNTLVWLHQLSQQYRQPISRLDQIPDDALEALASMGITGLWLIGLWERSPASQRIKQLAGDTKAAASAYAIYEYAIAANLGGRPAFQALRSQALQHGIRLASDMVPNHMGIDSRWVVEQPDLFLGVPQPPFPTYSFNGPDLSPQQQVSIHLEDHYTDRTDAAVVFQRLDRSSGQARYIYHGNDGTHMPWNDTAQLDFLNPQTREAVIQEILKVARDFPIIRFDAAMTLVKEHIQRLWYPGPGSRGAVPSRHDHGLSPEQFDALIPQEFWRQVVERIALDAPNTLLLAEAFWLMEGYFVHSLGMHRVYNSAFMHMLRDEDNANFRKLLRNTLSFDPRILARFVNFMSNPDEQTAVEQFGRDDKYFGICTLLATLPGLPMFAHGQFEGLSEKYGMEYARPRLDEQPDENLLARHHRQIVPLLHRRPLFAGIEHFELYDFITSHGEVCQDIIAFSNRDDNHCALVVYHNKYADHAGWIKQGISNSLADALALDVAPHTFTTFRDHLTGLEYIYANSELRSRGLPLQLDAYKARVFLDFHQVLDDQDQRCAKLARHLAGAGVPSLAHAFHQLHWSSANLPLHTLYHPDLFTPLLQAASPPLQAAAIDQLIAQFTAVASAAQPHASPAAAHAALKADLRRRLQAVLCLDSLAERFPLPRSRKYKSVQSILAAAPQGPLFTRLVFVAWALTDALAALLPRHPGIFTLDSWFQVWQLDQILSHLFQQFGLDVDRALAAVRILLSQHSWRRLPSSRRQRSYRTLLVWLDDAQVQRFLQCSSQRGILSFNPTAAEHFLWLMLALAAVEITAAPSSASPAAAEQIVDAYDIVFKLLKTLPSSRAQVGIWLEAVKP